MLEAADEYYRPPIDRDQDYLAYCRNNRKKYNHITGNKLPDLPLMQGRQLAKEIKATTSRISESAEKLMTGSSRNSVSGFISDIDKAVAAVRVLSDAMYLISTDGTWHAKIEGFDTGVFEWLMTDSRPHDTQKDDVRKGLEDFELILDTIEKAFESCDHRTLSGTAYYTAAAEMLLRLIETRVIDLWNGQEQIVWNA